MSTAPLRAELERALPERPFEVEFWDGGTLAPTNGAGPTFRVRGPAAIGHLLRAPGQLGLGRAYVTGALEPDDLDAALELVDDWKPPQIDRGTRMRLLRAAIRANGLRLPPRRPQAELVLSGRRHTRERDLRAVRHHYDVGNDFFALFLDDSMTYSCAFFSRGGPSLEEAQLAKHELTCAKLDLREGQSVLDVGCGWGAFAIHAAANHGVNVLGITLSEKQAELARRRVEERGLADRIEIRVMDYREVPALGRRFDAVASIGMVEHVGEEQIDAYARTLADSLAPGGRLLNHGIASLPRSGGPEGGPFSERFVFPDGAVLPLWRIQLALERAGFVTDHVEGFAADYAETLRHWLERFEARLDDAVRLGGAERTRVWRLYLRASRRGFEHGLLSIYQVRCAKPQTSS